MRTLLLAVLLLSLSACASFVEKCHEFSKYVDIKAIDCASKESKSMGEAPLKP